MRDVGHSDVVAPSHAVAEATLTYSDELARIRKKDGRGAMQVAAMGMHKAAIAVLGAEIGLVDTRSVLEVSLEENSRLASRDVDLKVPRRARKPTRVAT